MMVAINWTCTIGATSFTSITQSLSFGLGRSSIFDTWNGTNCTITVRNNTGQAANIRQGDIVTIGNNLSVKTLTFYAVEVTFQDNIAQNANTATITARDALGQIYSAIGNNDLILGINNSIDQAVELMTEIGYYPPNLPATNPPGRAIISDIFDLTTVGERIGEILNTENSFYYYDGQAIEFRESAAPEFSASTFTLDNTTGIVYSDLNRKYPNTNYPNDIRLTSTDVGQTIAVDETQYPRLYNRQVLFEQAAQQQAQTDFFKAVFTQDDQPYFDLIFNDSSQTSAKMTIWLDEIESIMGKCLDIIYVEPGVGNMTRRMVVEGATMSAVPGQSVWNVFLTPSVIYDMFTLDSSVYGVLGGDGIVYNQPEINYDETGWVYNDSNADDTASRLGW